MDRMPASSWCRWDWRAFGNESVWRQAEGVSRRFPWIASDGGPPLNGFADMRLVAHHCPAPFSRFRRLWIACRDTPNSLAAWTGDMGGRSEEHTSELQSLMRISYAVFCLKKKNNN